MSDMPQTQEAIALMLLYRIADAENWTGAGAGSASLTVMWKKSRADILDTYRDCLDATKGMRDR